MERGSEMNLALSESTGLKVPGIDGRSLSRKITLVDMLIKAMLENQTGKSIRYSSFIRLQERWLYRARVNVREFADQINPPFARLAAAPEIAGHEQLLIAMVGHQPQAARFWAYFIKHLGVKWTAEVNDGRRAGSIVRKLVKTSEKSVLVISNRASKLQQLCREGHASVAMEKAIRDAGVTITECEFDTLVAKACDRDDEACRSLTTICKLLVARLPDPRGRLQADATGIHVFLQRHLESFGSPGAHTYSPVEEKYTDAVTLAARQATQNGRFSPQRPNALLKSGGLPPVERVLPQGNTRPRSRR